MSHSPDYTTLRHRPIAALLLSLAAVSAFFLLFPGLDLAVSRLFYFPGGGFVFADDPALELLRSLGKLATIAVIIAIAAALLAPGLAGRFLPGLMPSKALYLLAIYAIGPGLIVNAFFKQVFGRARPYELFQFGGDLAFSHVWAVSDACSGNCSFTSGEASAAAALIALIALLPKRYRLPVGGLITFFAALVSLNRIAFGGHFLSDTVLSWLVVLLVVDFLRPWFFGPRGVAIDVFFARAAMRLAPLHRPSLKAFAEAATLEFAVARRRETVQSATMPNDKPLFFAAQAPGDRSAPPSASLRRAPYRLLSVVIPARNEARNLAILVEEIAEALAHRDHEIVVVDDGSTDETAQTLVDLKAKGRSVRHVRHDRSCGQSRAVRSGMLAAHGDLIVTIDGDGQNDPAFIPALAKALEAAGRDAGLAAGQRVGRTDTRIKQLSSRFANGLRTAILKDQTRDTGCGLKAIPTDLFRRLPFFDGWHRYLPALVLREGYRVVHVDVKDRNRRFGKSNYGIFDRGLRGVLDLYGVWWLLRRARNLPMVGEVDIRDSQP